MTGNGAHRVYRTLVLGFGNIYRRDDGVAYAVLNALRERLGRLLLDVDDDGFDDLGHPIDTVLLHQLVPELAEVAAPYDCLVFVDAHVGAIEELVRQEELEACFRHATVSHQLHPCTLLALVEQMRGDAPRGVLISVRGHDFDFGEGLSEETAALVPEAVERVLAVAHPKPCEG
jgi:hydrogenase maturation protease